MKKKRNLHASEGCRMQQPIIMFVSHSIKLDNNSLPSGNGSFRMNTNSAIHCFSAVETRRDSGLLYHSSTGFAPPEPRKKRKGTVNSPRKKTNSSTMCCMIKTAGSSHY